MLPRVRNQLTRVINSMLRGTVRRRISAKTLLILTVMTAGVFLNSMVGFHSHMKRRLMCSHVMHRGSRRQLSKADCLTTWPIGTGKLVPWSYNYPLVDRSTPGKGVPLPFEEPVGFVVHFTKCPEYVPPSTLGVDTTDVTKQISTFVDKAAIMKHTIACSAPGSITPDTTTATITTPGSTSTSISVTQEHTSVITYAMVHPDAVSCTGVDGIEYDQVSVLENLGYYVKIWDSPMNESKLNDQPFIKENIGQCPGLGLDDLVKLKAFLLTDHDYIVTVDQSYVLKKPLDELYAEINELDDFFMAYVRDPNTGLIDDKITVVKPSIDTLHKLVEIYQSVPYTEEGGWGNTGIGAVVGGGDGCEGMGTSGLLDYYMNSPTDNLLPHAGIELDPCLYANDADQACSTTPYEDIIGYQMTNAICGQPWECNYGEVEGVWSPETRNLCDTFLIHWVQSRADFQQLYFTANTTAPDGDYHKEIYQGICTGEGPVNYVPLLSNDEPEIENCIDGSLIYSGCDPNFTAETTSDIGMGLTMSVDLSYPQQCKVFYAGPGPGTGADVTFSGDAEIYGTASADTSMVFVIDRSGSTCDGVRQHCSSDENFDLSFDDILDCEIAAVLDIVAKVRAEGTVSHVGLVSFSQENRFVETATIELALTDISVPDASTFHAIENAIRAVNCGGSTNYAKAVEKACEVMDNSVTSNNVIMFISDGLPTTGGYPSAYCDNGATFHTLALGDKASCSSENEGDMSLQLIADSTGGTCQKVEQVADIRLILQQIAEVQFLTMQAAATPSESSVNWGCTDVDGFQNSYGMDCAALVTMGQCSPGEPLGMFTEIPDKNTFQTGAQACCACGGGVYRNFGELEQVENSNYVPQEDSKAAVSFEKIASLQVGPHTVCTTVTGSGAGVPVANVQCRSILVCPNVADSS